MKKRLIIRLSSLGDVILASSVLALPGAEASGIETHWLVKREFAELLEGHPAIHRVWTYDKSLGLPGWRAICRAIAVEGFDDIYDLQSSLRTRLAAWLVRGPRWHRVAKQRWRLIGYFIFKGRWPHALRPEAWVARHCRMIEPAALPALPNLRHLLGAAASARNSSAAVPSPRIASHDYYCVMPSSLWPAKSWPVRAFLELIRRLGPSVHPVILGTQADEQSRQLVHLLETQGVTHTSGVGLWRLGTVAQVLAGARFYVGGDTGLSHLAESVGTRAFVLFGPTVPDMGFGPSRPESKAVGVDLWCRPCGKDGRFCIRPINRYLCMTSLHPERVIREVAESLR
jgi:heptosyltransferase-2